MKNRIAINIRDWTFFIIFLLFFALLIGVSSIVLLPLTVWRWIISEDTFEECLKESYSGMKDG